MSTKSLSGSGARVSARDVEKIKACPFCGSRRVEVSRTNEDACWINCARIECGAQTSCRPTRAGAIRIWNLRVNSVGLAKVVYDMDAEWEANHRKAVAK